ncbi:hypothetical protein TNCV_1367771 [Trichonephila clavipes]|nr:hypothetical protein TNCV_1367771 [Trichonephila clavipes]
MSILRENFEDSEGIERSSSACSLVRNLIPGPSARAKQVMFIDNFFLLPLRLRRSEVAIPSDGPRDLPVACSTLVIFHYKPPRVLLKFACHNVHIQKSQTEGSDKISASDTKILKLPRTSNNLIIHLTSRKGNAASLLRDLLVFHSLAHAFRMPSSPDEDIVRLALTDLQSVTSKNILDVNWTSTI